MTEQQQQGAEILAYFTAMGMYISGSLTEEIIELAHAQSNYMVNVIQNYFVDRCIELADDEDLDLQVVLKNHSSYQYWRQVELDIEEFKKI